MAALIGAGISAAASIAGGMLGAGKAKNAKKKTEKKVGASLLQQQILARRERRAVEPLLMERLAGAREGATRARNALGGAVNVAVREARGTADRETGALEAGAAGSGLEYSSALEGRKRAILGGVNRSLLGLELNLAQVQAAVEGAAQGQVNQATGALIQSRMRETDQLSDVERQRIQFLTGAGMPDAPATPNFAGLFASLFGVPTEAQMQGGIFGAF